MLPNDCRFVKQSTVVPAWCQESDGGPKSRVDTVLTPMYTLATEVVDDQGGDDVLVRHLCGSAANA
jgi:hypothetical protein